MVDGNRNKKILVEFIHKVWSEGKIDLADKYIAPLYTIYHDPGDPWDKKELDLMGYKERVSALRAPFPDQCFDIQELVAEEDAVVVTWLWTATHKGDLPGFPASGRKIMMSGSTVYYFEDDRLAGHWQITDRLGVFQQLRQVPA